MTDTTTSKMRLIIQPTRREQVGYWIRGQVGYQRILVTSVAVLAVGVAVFVGIGVWVNL